MFTSDTMWYYDYSDINNKSSDAKYFFFEKQKNIMIIY